MLSEQEYAIYLQKKLDEEVKKLKFKKKAIGGVDEADVLKKIEGLISFFRTELENQYRALEAARENLKKEG